MAEIPNAERFLYERLVAANVAGGRVFSGIAPAGTTEPFVTIQLLSAGNDVVVIGGERIWAAPLFQVKAVAETGSWSTLAATADALDAALQNTDGSAGSGNVWSCQRERPWALITDDNLYRHLGGEYRLRVT